MAVSLTFLGGLGEIGRNCAAVEIDGQLVLVDCGLMFPEEDMLGVDLVLPDFSWVFDRIDDLVCVVLTHGHEDHMGALAYFLREANVPVYGTELTVEFASTRIAEMEIDAELVAVTPGEWVEVGNGVTFAMVHVAHSVPQAVGVVFDTPEGLIAHSGDFKLDPTPIDGKPTDLATFGGFGRRGVRLLLADSTNAERDGFTPSEASVGPPLRHLTAEASGRVIIACFASHVHRVQQAIDAVAAAGRKLAFLGRSMVRNVEIASALGALHIPDGLVLPLKEVIELPEDEMAVISTGSQGEPFAALSLLAQQKHKGLELHEGDSVIISATPIPGNETRVSRVINNLVRKGIVVYHGRNANVHVSGHAARDELRTFYNVVQPEAFVPVHGEVRHLHANAQLARSVGVPHVEVLENGDRIVLDGDEITVERSAVPAGYVYIDGDVVGDVDEVLRDRRHLADDGVLIVTVGVDRHTGEIVNGPDADSHGVSDDTKDLHAGVVEDVIEAIHELQLPVDPDALRQAIRLAAARSVKRQLSRRPVVFPLIIEI